MRSSLLVKKQIGDEDAYQLFPFMNQYAKTHMSVEDKYKYHDRITKYYSRECRKLLELQYLEERLSKLVSFETNIWACLYRIRERFIEIENETGRSARTKSPSVHSQVRSDHESRKGARSTLNTTSNKSIILNQSNHNVSSVVS